MSGFASPWTAFRRWVPWLALTNAMFWAALWIAHAADGAQRDWSHFHDTARLVLAGRVNEIYPGHTHGLPFLHPPYFAVALIPFGLLSRTAGYFACISATVLALAAALWLLRRSLPRTSPADRRRFAVGALVVVGSASWNVMLALGQVSAWYLLILCATLSLWMRGQRAWAGAVVALMMLKPNLGAVFPVIFLARGQWRLLAGWCAGFLVLLLATLPFGVEVWVHYLTFMRSSSGLIDKIPVWRQHTMRAFWHSFVDAPALLLALWAASAFPLVAATAWAWLKTELVARNLPRLFGVTVLMLVTCNPYLHHYDTLILAVPGLVWYLDRDSYRSPALYRVCGGCLLVAYLIQMVSVWLVQGGWSLVGPPLAVWLLAEAFDLARRPTGSPVGSARDAEGVLHVVRSVASERLNDQRSA